MPDYIFQAKVDVNERDNNGAVPMYFAAQEGHVEVIRFLLQHNADPLAKVMVATIVIVMAVIAVLVRAAIVVGIVVVVVTVVVVVIVQLVIVVTAAFVVIVESGV